ncbi:MAG: glycosyltransferase family 4 protein [Cyanobacteriota bacterium]|nr:glycosyltransferase family 4 protein [Cyanobacteriota bacterium]
MKIISLTNCPLDPRLGSGKTVLRWSEGLRNLGHVVEVYEPKDYQLWQGIRRGMKFRLAGGAWSCFKNKIQVGKYDLVEFYGDEFWLLLTHLTAQKKRPFLIAHTNGLELLHRDRARVYNPPQSLRERAYNRFAEQTHDRFSRIAFNRVDAFVSICELDRRYVLDRNLYPPEKTAVVEPGLDSEYLSIPFSQPRQNRLAYVGSWTPRKGLDQLCTVASAILTRHPQLVFDLYGTNISPDVVINAFPVELRTRIVVYPHLSTADIAQGLAKAKIFFFPSQYEGFGMAVAEAMACGCAVVTTPTGFGADLKSGREATICDFDDTEAMERAIDRLLTDETFRLKIARSGYERVKNLRWDLAVRQLEQTYLNWLSQWHQS